MNKSRCTVMVNWLDDCPACGNSEAMVKTQGYGAGYLWAGDQASCARCEHQGEIDSDGESAWVEWDEVRKGGAE